MATIELRKVRKSFGKVDAIRGIDARFADGEFIVIVGPSGCGKSTLLRMVAGLETVSEGEIVIDGEVVNNREPMERNVAMVFQNYALYPHMTVEQNMGYGLKIAGMPKGQIREKIEEAAKLLQLESLLDRKPKQLSGGQRQRVAMGRAIVREPSLFLFDEPLSNLDAKLRVQMRIEIKELQSNLGTTALYVTHDQTEAMTMADTMLIMNNGIVEQIATPLQAYQKPKTVFAAQFIGNPAMNVVEAEVEGDGVFFGGVLICGKPRHFNGKKIKLGIRPEHIGTDSQSDLKLKIKVAEPLGANTIVHGVVEGLNEPLTVSLQGLQTQGLGDSELDLSFPKEHCHLFDPESENRLEETPD